MANHIIANNRNRVLKELYTMKLNERRVVYHHNKSEREEADFVAETILARIKHGESAKDFAVLYRSSFMSRGIEQRLLRNKIPYSVWGGVKFFERKEIKDVICYLRLIASDADDLAFTRVVNLPARKFGNKSLAAIRSMADAAGISLMEALRHAVQTPGFNKRPLHEFIALIDSLRSLSVQMRCRNLPTNFSWTVNSVTYIAWTSAKTGLRILPSWSIQCVSLNSRAMMTMTAHCQPISRKSRSTPTLMLMSTTTR